MRAEHEISAPAGKSVRNSIDKLDFMIAGTQKSGTSVLHYYLDQHPNVTMAYREELRLLVQPRRHFFDNEKQFNDGKVDYELLHRNIPVTEETKVVGACTPIYTYWKPAIERIYNYNPSIKLVILLRNPIERAFSHWNMQRDRDLEPLDFLDAIEEEKNRARAALPRQLRKYSYVERGFYSQQIKRVFHYFPREQTLIIKFDDLRRNYREIGNRVFDFLNVPRLDRLQNREENSTKYSRSMTQAERKHLYSIFAEDIVQLENILRWDCSDWKL